MGTDILAIEIKRGTKLLLEGEVFVVVDFDRLTPGNWRGMVRTKLRGVKTGRVMEKRFQSTEKVEEADLERINMQFLYRQGDEFHFMNINNYEQVMLPAGALENEAQFLKEETEISVLYHKGEPLAVELPTTVQLKVVETHPATKGDTVNRALKDATLETGLMVKVPMFLSEGDYVKVDTRTGEYLERV